MFKILKFYLAKYCYNWVLCILKLKNYMIVLFCKKSDRSNIKSIILNIDLTEYLNTFFGYFDRSPFNPKTINMIILHANNANPNEKPSPYIPTDIIIYDYIKDRIIKVVESVYSWNWQQGARLHWLDEDNLIYNFYDEQVDLYKSKIYTLSNDKKRILDVPVQDSYKMKYCLSISYESLNIARPDYGYRNKIRKEVNLNEIYIKKYDLGTDKIEELTNTEILLNKYFSHKNKINRRSVRINHLLISPDGKKFIFLFRFLEKYKLKHILFLYDFNTREEKILIDHNMVSHYCWIDNENILFWGIINNVGDYYIINSDSLQINCLDLNLSDGHPTMLNTTTFITDTYPDKSRMRSLLKVNFSNKKIKKLSAFYESPRFIGETRCDLHPNISPDGKYIHIDTIYTGKRLLHLLEI